MRSKAIGHGCAARRAVVAALMFGGMTALTVPASSAPKQDEQPLLKPVSKADCLAMYDLVELRLKGRGDEVTSITTRNGLKDFFVNRPGVVDCTGQREIPWRDAKDREFIESVLKSGDEASTAKFDMARDYAVGPAPRPVTPR